MEEWLRARLLGLSGMGAAVGTRIDWGARQQGAPLPAIELHLLTGQPGMHLAGADGWINALVQADCWGRTFLAARNVGDIIEHNMTGLRVDEPAQRVRIFVRDRRSDRDTNSAGIVYRSSVDLAVMFFAQT
ncbi:DUF3168 domain-containing protein [Sphingomonas sp. MMS24-J13]|uniref:tail completion protein gp17 n=1 Tax=Sphingomonas sp. MMS24-J13 TaxID=3238686 RepID=UPI00384F8328